MKSITTADSRYTKEFTMASSSKKSTTIVNQYQYTDPLMAEVQDGYAAQTYKNYITLIIIAIPPVQNALARVKRMVLE